MAALYAKRVSLGAFSAAAQAIEAGIHLQLMLRSLDVILYLLIVPVVIEKQPPGGFQVLARQEPVAVELQDAVKCSRVAPVLREQLVGEVSRGKGVHQLLNPSQLHSDLVVVGRLAKIGLENISGSS